MVNSVECSTDIEQGQKGDFRSIYSPIDVREEADKQGFSGVAFSESWLISREEVI